MTEWYYGDNCRSKAFSVFPPTKPPQLFSLKSLKSNPFFLQLCSPISDQFEICEIINIFSTMGFQRFNAFVV